MITNDLQQRIAASIEDLTGLQAATLDPKTPLTELGLDSLTLTQLTTTLKKAFGVEIGFREFVTTTQTLEAITQRIAAVAPPAAVPAPVHAAKSVKHETATPSAVSPPVVSPMRPIGRRSDSGRGVTSAPLNGAVSESSISAFVPVLVGQLDLLAAQLQVIASSQGLTIDVSTAHDSAPVAVPAASPADSAPPVAPVSAAAPANAPVASTMPPAPVGFGSTVVGSLTPQQEQAIARFTERWNRKSAKSKEMINAQRSVHADPRTASGYNPRWKELVYPIVVERSKGAYLWDIDGNRYVDLLSGFGPTFFGHNPPFIVEALKAQLERGDELGPATPLAGEAARLICELTGLDRACFACTGSEAVQAAIRIARTATGRNRIVVFAADYHGNFDEVLVRGLDGSQGPRTVPSAPGVPQRAVDDVTVLEYGSDRALAYIREHASDLAAVMVEPVQTRYPHIQPREFLRELRTITRDAGALLIFDEVVTGFRCQAGGAQAYYGIEADLVTYGKVLGGGMPIGVIAGRRPYIDVLDGGPWVFGDDSGPTQGVSFFAGTFVRHPLVVAAVHASLQYLKEAGPSLHDELNARAARYVAELNALIDELGVPIRVDHFASIIFWRPTDPRNPFNSLFWLFLREQGVFHIEGFPSYLTLAHTEADLAFAVSAYRKAMQGMLEATFWTSTRAAGTTSPARVAPHQERFTKPPVPGARLGRAQDGSAAWFVEDETNPGKYVQVVS